MMGDRLISLLQRFELRARVLRAGPLNRFAAFGAGDGLGHIHFVRSGGLRVETAGRAPMVVERPGVLFCMAPMEHQLVPLDGAAEIVCASFEFGAGLQNPMVTALPGILSIDQADLSGMTTMLDLLFAEASEDQCGGQAVIDRLTEVLIIQLLRELMNLERMETGLLAGLSDPHLAKAINAMHADPERAWTLESLADLATMSRARFAVRFRDTVGMTPMHYLSAWRLSVAQSLLRRGGSLQTIASQVGYGSARALSRAFTVKTGLSPSAWRRQQNLL